MRKAVLFIAMSLDGYIADHRGSVDWLQGQGGPEEDIDTYSAFIKDVDTVIMGWNTYHQITTELSPDQWVYSDLLTYVITHRDRPSADSVIFSKQSPCDMIGQLKAAEGKNIWICGGAEIIRQLMEEDLIDEYYISIIPTILGSGIRLFGDGQEERKLELAQTRAYNGIVEVVYRRRCQ